MIDGEPTGADTNEAEEALTPLNVGQTASEARASAEAAAVEAALKGRGTGFEVSSIVDSLEDQAAQTLLDEAGLNPRLAISIVGKVNQDPDFDLSDYTALTFEALRAKLASGEATLEMVEAVLEMKSDLE